VRAEPPVGAEREQRRGQGREAISTRIEVISTVQVKIGIRNIVIPGARMHTMVVMKLTAPRMVPNPASASPNTHRSPPRPGLLAASDSGA